MVVPRDFYLSVMCFPQDFFLLCWILAQAFFPFPSLYLRLSDLPPGSPLRIKVRVPPFLFLFFFFFPFSSNEPDLPPLRVRSFRNFLQRLVFRFVFFFFFWFVPDAPPEKAGNFFLKHQPFLSLSLNLKAVFFSCAFPPFLLDDIHDPTPLLRTWSFMHSLIFCFHRVFPSSI